MKSAYLDYGNAVVGSDGAARVAPRGGWHRVVEGHHPLVDKHGVHCVVEAMEGRLYIAVSAGSDAELYKIFSDGPGATVARRALHKAGALTQGRAVAVAPGDAWPRDCVVVIEDHALCADGEDRGELLLGFSPQMNPYLLEAFTPQIADAMRTHMATVPPPGQAASMLEGITSSVLPTPRPEPAPAARPAPDDGLVVGGPAWQRFWFGNDSQDTTPAPDFGIERFRTRVMNDSGAAQILTQEHALNWDDLTAEQREQMYLPGPAPSHTGLDLAALMLRTRTEDWTWDGAYTRVSPHRLTEDLTDIQPTDVSALRWGLVAPRAFTPDRRLSPHSRRSHAIAAVTTTAAYLAVDHTHFIPEHLALDVATTAPLSQRNRAALRLPGPWAMILHEPVPLTAVQAGDEELDALLDGQIPGSSHAVLGAVLAANPDHTLDTTLGLILMTSVHPERGRQWYLQPALYGDHAAGRLLYSYAAQLTFAKWRKPAAPPVQERGKPGSAKALKRLAKHPDARAGALHRMNLLDYTPPPAEPRPGSDTTSGSGAELEYGTWRRASWTENTRIGIRDENGNLVGPVYKDSAVEGQTYTRGSIFRARSRIRADLPLRPHTCTVYQLPDGSSTAGDTEPPNS
ncbi:hypothetical protein [Streptomyces sp. NPDC094049]|uniref:hypothetical protein n=1 Tax=Streptomyces sp. NPDC094049 TaxID=3154987 RepID=UPI003317FB4C